MNINKYILVFLAAISIRVSAVGAHPVDTLTAGGNPFVLEQFKKTNPLAGLDNASAVMLGERLLYADVSLGTEIGNGSFHRPQQPKRVNNYLFSAEGSAYLGSFYVSGGFRFQQAKEREVQFNSIFNPYRGTPYIIADSTGGNWTKQSYAMWAKLASPFVNDRLSFGLTLGLDVNRGAKKIDPRPQSNTNRIDIAPSVTLRLAEKHSLSASFLYSRFRENVNLMLYDSGESQKIYLLKGMGQYTYDIFSGNDRERKYAGDSYGAAVDYIFLSDRVSLVAGGKYNNYLEDASDIENNKPRLRGRLYETDWQGYFHLTLKGNRAWHTVKASYAWQERSGREVIQVFNSSPEVNAWVMQSEAPRRSVVATSRAGIEYALYLSPTREGYHRWRFAVGSSWTDFSDDYKVLDSYIRYQSALTTLSVERIIPGETCYFKIGLDGSYNGVWDRDVNYTVREENDQIIGEKLINPDYQIMTSHFVSGFLNLTAGYELKNDRSIWLKVGGGYLKTSDERSRTDFRVSLGYTF
ncbi:hypothetical protein M2137_001182 [Parabacteroides sp. PFB2-10]|uniref:DUF6850 family outer membrane beta-barrel protein n=1 Tax=Parabacteroides sp. PFB2-10 TaxID=1742405 RepID=UPI002475584C|nr:DUF6850 family outer membrane beta-barrel protein [Parabacteroides sp. PFB2-10]MDH6312411.1 hypothetical protein [Parabacteroides sp. PFB2-10]